MKKLLLGPVVLSAIVFGTFLFYYLKTQAPSAVGVLLHDDQTGENVEFGTCTNTLGQVLSGPAAWKSRTGERIELTHKFLRGHQFVLVHLVVAKTNISRSFYRIVPVRSERPELWEGGECWVVGDHFRVDAFVGGLVVSA
jgi:hypothetical protein